MNATLLSLKDIYFATQTVATGLKNARKLTEGTGAMSETALKYDSGKPPLGLIPRSALIGEAAVMGFGASKYGRDNWRKGMEWSRLVDAALRHITAFNEGEDIDPESGLHHLGHARCCLAFLAEYVDKQLGTDDRPRAGGTDPDMAGESEAELSRR